MTTERLPGVGWGFGGLVYVWNTSTLVCSTNYHVYSPARRPRQMPAVTTEEGDGWRCFVRVVHRQDKRGWGFCRGFGGDSQRISQRCYFTIGLLRPSDALVYGP